MFRQVCDFAAVSSPQVHVIYCECESHTALPAVRPNIANLWPRRTRTQRQPISRSCRLGWHAVPENGNETRHEPMESAKIASESSDSFRRAPAFVDAADGNWPDFWTAFETGRCRNHKRISLKLMVTLFAKEADFHESGSSITRSELPSNAKFIWSLQRHSSRLFPAFLNIAPHANLQKPPVFRLPGCRDTRAKLP